MLHWPDSMVTFRTGDNILFSNDAFGQHYAVEELFNDKADQCLLNKEAMKYFSYILNPFGCNVEFSRVRIHPSKTQIHLFRTP